MDHSSDINTGIREYPVWSANAGANMPKSTLDFALLAHVATQADRGRGTAFQGIFGRLLSARLVSIQDCYAIATFGA
jgi:hypothetical protein